MNTSQADNGLTRLQPIFHEAGPGLAKLRTHDDAADHPHRERERNNFFSWNLEGLHPVGGAGFQITQSEADGWEQNVKSHVGRKLNKGQYKSVASK